MKHPKFFERILLFALLFGSLITPGIAFDVDRSIEKGAMLKADQDVKLRTSPPSSKGFFFVGGPGKEVGAIKSGEKVQVESVKKFKVPLREDVWIKVKTESGIAGWAFYGTDEKPANFEMIK